MNYPDIGEGLSVGVPLPAVILSGMSNASERPAIVYEAVNRVNGKRYIGVTVTSLAERVSAHFGASGRKCNGCIYRAGRKYGREALVFSVRMRCASFKEALAQERILIAAERPEYNRTKGGEGILGFKMPADVLAKRGLHPSVLRGKPRTPEVIEKMRVANTGRKLTLSDEEKDRRRQQLVWVRALRPPPKSKPPARPRGRQIRSIPDGLIFRTGREAAKHYGVSASCVCTVASGRNDAIRSGVTFDYVDPAAVAAANILREERREARACALGRGSGDGQ